jgi:hypothetical protein
MFEKFFQKHPEFTTICIPAADQIVRYQDQLPNDLLLFWKEYGFGNFMNGYLKVLDPSTFQPFMQNTYAVYKEPTTVFAATAFGDLLIWEGEYIKQLNYRTGKTDNGGSSISKFFNVILSSWAHVEASMQAKQFRPAVERLGEPAFDECFAYVPALALGGSEKVENIQKVKLREHLMILSQLVGVIE